MIAGGEREEGSWKRKGNKKLYKEFETCTREVVSVLLVSFGIKACRLQSISCNTRTTTKGNFAVR